MCFEILFLLWGLILVMFSYFHTTFFCYFDFFELGWVFFGILKDGLVKCSYYYMNFHLFNMNRCILCSFCCFDCFCPTWCDNCNINCQVNTTSVQCPLHHCMSHKCIKQHPNMLWPVIQHEQFGWAMNGVRVLLHSVTVQLTALKCLFF